MRVLLIDDHTLFRDGLKILLGNIDQCNEVLDVASGQAAISLIDEDDDILKTVLEVNYGYAVGEAEALKRIVSQ